MIRSSVDIWTSSERTLMSSFRMRFFTTYRECEDLSPRDILYHLIEILEIEWDDEGDLPEDIYSMHKKMDGYTFSGSSKYQIVTDHKVQQNPRLLLESFFHELAHIFLKHTPAHAGK